MAFFSFQRWLQQMRTPPRGQTLRRPTPRWRPHLETLEERINLSVSPLATDAGAVSANEGSSVTNTGTYSDPDGNSTVVISASVGTVTQDSTNGTWSWTYTPTEEAAAQNVTITANDGTLSTQTTFSLTVNDAPLTATATPVTTAVYATPFSGEVATFSDANPNAPLSDFPLANVTIQWGDGSTSNATSITQPGGPGTAFDVFGDDTYGQAGTPDA
ncbi:MAG: hypothetical protein B7Z73_10710 [Planctomycetia bacterium 21-64-5]|nr:MAG: hypothetical protein B7Z73_10710 [Planctomycetia bacterium 21-64-5]